VSQAFLEVDTQIAAPRRILLSEFAESLGLWLCNLHVLITVIGLQHVLHSINLLNVVRTSKIYINNKTW